jgi:hypothetical protein
MMRSVCSVKRFHLGGKCFVDDEEAETEVRKWLRQQSKYLYAAGFDALLNRWNTCIHAGGGYVEKRFFLRLEYHVFYVLYPFVTYFLTLPRNYEIVWIR